MFIKSYIKKIYRDFIPEKVKKYLLVGLKKIYSPLSRLKRFLVFEGDFKVKLDNYSIAFTQTGNSIEVNLFWEGISSYEPISIEICKRFSKSSSTILDIGSNTGLYALVAKTINPLSNVYAFEPLPEFVDILKRIERESY